ncbi:MAG: phage late control D family protein [Zoogloeaceae bacterium]|jgi:phage protein D|nr:phage late control D family protein [Zoogloeaceae bacterium]
MQPIWRITLEGEDLTGKIQPRLMELTLTDNRGLEADQLDFTLDDADGLLAIPPRGAKIRLALGWEHSGLIDKGSYTVDEIEHSGSPDKLTVRARSADVGEAMGEKKERSWHRVTVGAIVKKIAKEHDLAAVISPDLTAQAIAHIDQTSESDASFLTRLAQMFDALATVKSGKLLFYKIGRGRTLTGIPLEAVTLRRGDGDSHRFAFTDREHCDCVKAFYYDTAKRTKGEVQARIDAGKKKNKSIGATADTVKTLRHTYASKSGAQRAAQSALDKIQRGVASFSLTLSQGRPELIPELPAKVIGWKPEIDGADWLITKVTHRLSNSGYISEVEMELRLESGDEDAGADEGDG